MSDLDARIQQRNEELLAQWEDKLSCLDDWGDGTCEGQVEYRMPLSGTGIPYPRCDGHWHKRLEEDQRIEATYGPNSDSPPDWYDPYDAGEYWGEDL